MSIEKMKLCDVHTSSLGRKIAKLTHNEGEDVFYGSTNGLISPFGPSNFDKNGNSQRLSLDIRIDNAQMVDYFSAIDALSLIHI